LGAHVLLDRGGSQELGDELVLQLVIIGDAVDFFAETEGVRFCDFFAVTSWVLGGVILAADLWHFVLFQKHLFWPGIQEKIPWKKSG
jgi:hypothetical protein